jgi:hypothetical protein
MKLSLKRKKSSKTPRKKETYVVKFFFRSELSIPIINTSNGNEIHDNENKILTDSIKTERVNIPKESSTDAETKAAKQRELIPYETRIKQFREMLAEKQVKLYFFYLIFVFYV